MEKNEAMKRAKDFDEILDIQYGKVGTELRDQFEENARRSVISELLKETKPKSI